MLSHPRTILLFLHATYGRHRCVAQNLSFLATASYDLIYHGTALAYT